MPGKVRRIVTGVTASGRSCIVSDTLLPTTAVAPGAPVRAGLWTTDSAPASNTGSADPVPDGIISPDAACAPWRQRHPRHRHRPRQAAGLRSRRATPAELQD